MTTASPPATRSERTQSAAAPASTPILSLVVPVRNEAACLPATLTAIGSWIADARMAVEVIVVDDGSDDGTRATAAAFERRIEGLRILRHVEGRGDVEAVRTGELAAAGTLIAFGRADSLASSLEGFPDLLGALLDGADVAVLPVARNPRLTPVPERDESGLARSCRAWLRNWGLGREPRRPALLLSRAPALRRMLDCQLPTDPAHDPDWGELARRGRCDFRLVRPGSPPTP